MDLHQNARLTLRSRELLARYVLEDGFTPFNGVRIAQTTVVRVASGGVAMRVKLGSVSPITNRPPEWTFVVANHEWKRPLIDDVR